MDHKELKAVERATPFKETRKNRLFEILEDYTEIIADLIESQCHVRICDIACRMGVSHVSVLKTIKRLVRDGYVEKHSQIINLTLKGKQMALFSKRKHLILSEFLLKIGVPEHIAAIDVEGIEHYISPTTLEALSAHMSACFQEE
jgi:DtxR family transcriptional regulator, manganese transport regulator